MVVFFFLEKQIIFQNKNFNTFFKDRGYPKYIVEYDFFWKNVCFLVLPNTVLQVMGHPRRCCCFFFRFLPAKTTATTTRCPMPSCSSGRSGTQQPIISSIDSSSSAIVVINISIIKSQKSFYFLLKKLWKYSYRWRIFFRENPQVSNLFNVDNSVNKINNISLKDNFGKPIYY